jgi:hypothetical protein
MQLQLLWWSTCMRNEHIQDNHDLFRWYCSVRLSIVIKSTLSASLQYFAILTNRTITCNEKEKIRSKFKHGSFTYEIHCLTLLLIVLTIRHVIDAPCHNLIDVVSTCSLVLISIDRNHQVNKYATNRFESVYTRVDVDR